ncbi:predicted protein [Uncinocarpus reesii 1704]|uniref:Protein kinase domain-containing protein n=1 Tax=Uncinocarpus reesii (strain UAMH 1704) TaxID=336963 RepID=C4JUF1_UNCRE|nr:uncharacterized protein UREG_04754 [Uncinocarpus reesii 1704]EEP79912.1 predicted protein [Uncinocarpus reesii 1704]
MRILKQLGRLQLAFFHTHQPTQDQFLCLGLLPLGATLQERIAPRNITSIYALISARLTKVLALHEQGICHGDISHANIALGVHPEALHETFRWDDRSYIQLVEVPGPPPPRPANLPEYIVFHQFPLQTNRDDLSLLDIIDFGKGLSGG